MRGERHMSPLISGDCRHRTRARSVNATTSSSKVSCFDFEIDHESTCEIDNHADTTCFGPNFRVTYMTDQECNVYPFSDQYNPIESVPIVTACTAYDDLDTGETYILEFHQGLYFGNQMKHSLICPNQCRSYGIDMCDDPYDKNREIGFTDPIAGITIPFEMKGTFATFKTRVPRDKELQECIYITMTNDNPWNPSEFDANISTVTRMKAVIEDANPNEPQLSPDSYEVDKQLASASSIYPSPVLQQRMRNISNVSSARTRGRSLRVTADQLARRWGISIESARKTIKATTQEHVRQAVHPITRRFRTDLSTFRFRRLREKLSSDTAFMKVKSLQGNTCFQVFSSPCGFVQVYPLETKAEAGDALRLLTEDIGAPNEMITDGAQEQTGRNSEFNKRCKFVRCSLTTSEPYTHKQVYTEGTIKLLKIKWLHRMIKKQVPKRLWDYGLVFESEIMTRTVRGKNKKTAYEIITGETPDISEWLDFDFYDWVHYWDSPENKDNPKIGRWLGVSHRVGSALCYYVLKENGEVVSRTTVQVIPAQEQQEPEVLEKLVEYTRGINHILDDANFVIPPSEEEYMYIDDYEEEEQGIRQQQEDMPPDVDDYDTDTIDNIINTELNIQTGGQQKRGRVKKRARDHDGNLIGTRNANPVLDTSAYVVEFNDGDTQEIAANVILENLMAQCDSEGNQYTLFDGICGHRKNHEYKSIPPNDQRRTKTTRGWDIQLQWTNGETSWLPLRDVKNSNPIELAEYAIANELENELAFKWWVKHALRRRDHFISKVTSKYWSTTHKFGIEMPKSVEHALELDKKNGNTLWYDAIQKEMKNVKIAFREWEGGTIKDIKKNPQLLPGYTFINCRMNFEIKMDGNFTRKARFIARGDMTDAPTSITYSSVVSRESIRILFFLASLYDLHVLSADIGNAYLNAPCREKVYTFSGPEFGPEQSGKVMIIERALYGLKSSGASWRDTFASRIRDVLKYESTQADPDVWRRPATKRDGTTYYEYLCVYVDDILCISMEPEKTMEQIKEMYRLKDGSIAEPENYLGAQLSKFQTKEGDDVWAMSGRTYVKNAVKDLEETLAKEGEKLNSKISMPMEAKYKPELDCSQPLEPAMITRYQELIGTLRWATELGRIDILHEVSKLSSYNASPRKGHLEAVYRIFAYLKKKENSSIIFDATEPEIRESEFTECDWQDFYPEAEEKLPPTMPMPRGPDVTITCYVDADHAGNLLTRRSHTGIVIFLNSAPISWYSKRQNTVESSTFGSEFNALRIAVDQIEALRYKLRMFGVRVERPTNVYCDNKTVVTNSSLPESTLNKKHNAICYHRVREASAAGWVRIAWVQSDYNIADLFTKVISQEARKRHLEVLTF